MSEKYENIQGVINAKVIKLYFEDKDIKLLKYVKTLNNLQKERARQHLKTFLAVKKKNERRTY